MLTADLYLLMFIVYECGTAIKHAWNFTRCVFAPSVTSN